jgi:deferrochelatase/peroxidase EfeB
MAHAFVTVVVPFDDGRAEAVNRHLDGLGNLQPGPVAIALDGSAFVHFMSLTVVRSSSGDSAHLVLEAQADGYPKGVLRRLADTIGKELGDVLAAAGVRVAAAELGDFLVSHDRQVGQGWFSVPGVVFAGTPGMAVERIRRERDLASEIQGFLDGLPPQGSSLATLARVREHFFGLGDHKWAFIPQPVPPEHGEKVMNLMLPALWSLLRTFLWPLLVLPSLALIVRGGWVATQWGLGAGFAAGLWAAFLTFGAELVLGLIAAPIAYLRFRDKEKNDPEDTRAPSAVDVGEIMARENRCAQNHLAAISTMKRGMLRRLVLRFVFWFIGVSTRYFRPGTLQGIGTIHFARWILLPGTDKLLFFSNYSGSWESYLEDFILKAHEGLTGVWSNTQGFPQTENLAFGGAEHGDQFKSWGRRQQHPTRFWYSAYPDLTTDRVHINAKIRHGFATAATEADAAVWLTQFQFAPAEDKTLQTNNIPTLVFGGLAPLRHGRCLVLQLPDNAAANRRWLAQIEAAIGYGEGRPERSTLVLGLSASGLKRLGLNAEALATFPAAFQHGMAESWRSRLLGDVGPNAPQTWAWGGRPANAADAILNVYAESEDVLDRETGRRVDELPAGHKVVCAILMEVLPPRGAPIVEPFGFNDGVSQPIVRGARKWVLARNAIHVVEPGEMVLGYEDNSKHKPPSPSAGGHDIGFNGTYLVVRQLEQDVDKFNTFLTETAKGLVGDPRVPGFQLPALREWLAAKMVGRWRDGTSLVRNPDQPGSAKQPAPLPDNDFLFGTEDPGGLRCPFGAHIRRVNPRDTFDAGSKDQLTIANRHRIFRVGRAYPPQGGSPNPGLLFMCVNANLERQFEFVQQTYMLGVSFQGLENEVDAFARRPGLSDVLTIPTENGPLRVTGLRDFVTVRGGAYFFLPGRAAVGLLISGVGAATGSSVGPQPAER